MTEAPNPALDAATKLVEKAEEDRTKPTFDTAKEAVDKLAKGSGKTGLEKRLAAIILLEEVVGPKDPTQPGGENPDTNKYFAVKFESEDTAKGTVAAENTFYILKTAGKTLEDLKDSAPAATPVGNNKFDGWNPALDTNTAIDQDRTVKAQFSVKVFDPTHVEKMVVKEQPTKLVYTEGEKLELAGLVVTLTDNQGLTKDVAFADFAANGITAAPANDTALTLANNAKKVTLTKDNLTAETDALTVNAKVTPQNPPVVGPVDPTQPGGGNPDASKYWTVTFESADTTKGTVAAKNTVYVLKTETKTLADITAPEKTAKTGYEFEKWEPALDANTRIDKDLEVKAHFKASGTPTPQNPPVVGPVDPTDPNGGKPQDTSKYWTVTFESADTTKGTVAAKNTVYVLKTETKTLADITAPEKTAAQGYEFDKWEPALTNATTINKDMTVKAYFKATGTNPPTPPTPTPNPSLDDKIDDSNKKPVYPIDKDQGTGVIVKDPEDIVVGGKDEDGKNIPTVINPRTGEIIVNPGNDVDGPIVVTVVDTKTGEQKDIVINVIGHSSGINDNRYDGHDNWWYTPFRPSYSSSSSNISVNAERAKKVSRLEVRLVIGSKVLRKSIDGIEERTMMDIAPFIEHDRTMLPIRFVAEALGFNVQWDNENRTVILIDKENVVKIPVDTNKIIVNGKVYESDVKPVIRNDRTMLPIANIARALGLKDGKDIFWNGNTREVLITREVAK